MYGSITNDHRRRICIYLFRIRTDLYKGKRQYNSAFISDRPIVNASCTFISIQTCMQFLHLNVLLPYTINTTIAASYKFPTSAVLYHPYGPSPLPKDPLSSPSPTPTPTTPHCPGRVQSEGGHAGPGLTSRSCSHGAWWSRTAHVPRAALYSKVDTYRTER